MPTLSARLTRAASALAVSVFLTGAAQAQLPEQAIEAPQALRAPLNIVPPPMQSVLGPKETARASEKLAPQAAARQMKRAVRAVAAAPGSDSGIVQVGQLGTLQDAPVGLEEGYGQNLWRGARSAFVVDQMARLPAAHRSDSLRKIELTLHRSATAAPAGTVDGNSWYAARLQRFLALGDTAAVLAFEELTGAARNDAYAARALALAHIGRGNPQAACELVPPQRDRAAWADVKVFFLQLRIYCQLSVGDYDKAALSIDVNERSLADDRLFRDLAFLMAAQAPLRFGTAEDAEAARAAGTEPPIVLPRELTPLQIALLQLAGRPLSTRLMSVPAYFDAALALDPRQRVSLRLASALRAVLGGQMTAETFSLLAQEADLDGFAPLDYEAEDDVTGLPPAADAVFLAQNLRAVDALPDMQAAAIADALRRAVPRGLAHELIVVLDDRLRDLPAETTAAPDLALLMPARYLAGGPTAVSEMDESAAWSGIGRRLLDFGRADDQLGDLLATLQAAPQNPSSPPALPSAASVDAPSTLPSDATAAGPAVGTTQAASAVLAAPAVAPEPPRVPPIADIEAFRSELAAATPAAAAHMRLELAVYAGLGFDLPEDLTGMPAQAAPEATAIPDATATTAATERLAKLGTNQWTGDLILALVEQHAETPPADWKTTDIVTALSALRAAGLAAAADQLAGELLARSALRLAAGAPEHLLP